MAWPAKFFPVLFQGKILPWTPPKTSFSEFLHIVDSLYQIDIDPVPELAKGVLQCVLKLFLIEGGN